jgi:hypothetical protein
MQFASLTYSTANLGDHIQSIAAEQFLPRVDTYLDRDFLSMYSDVEAAIILNGWFMENPFMFPPPESLKPLLTSFHVADKRLLSPAGIAYLKKHGPIGCRDFYTEELLKQHGIDAYFSGCLTLTLEKPKKYGDKIIAVDVCKSVLSPFGVQDVVHLTHMQHDRKIAEQYLNEYNEAQLVITKRLHVAFPCIAFKTPVIFIIKPDDPRTKGIRALFPDAPIRNNAIGPILPGMTKTKEIVANLRDSCKKFVASVF